MKTMKMNDLHHLAAPAAAARASATERAGEAWSYPQAKAMPSSAIAARVAELEAENAKLREALGADAAAMIFGAVTITPALLAAAMDAARDVFAGIPDVEQALDYLQALLDNPAAVQQQGGAA